MRRGVEQTRLLRSCYIAADMQQFKWSPVIFLLALIQQSNQYPPGPRQPPIGAQTWPFGSIFKKPVVNNFGPNYGIQVQGQPSVPSVWPAAYVQTFFTKNDIHIKGSPQSGETKSTTDWTTPGETKSTPEGITDEGDDIRPTPGETETDTPESTTPRETETETPGRTAPEETTYPTTTYVTDEHTETSTDNDEFEKTEEKDENEEKEADDDGDEDEFEDLDDDEDVDDNEEKEANGTADEEEIEDEFEDLDEEEDEEKEAKGIADEEEIEDEFEDLDENENEPEEKEAGSKSDEDENQEEFEELDEEEFEELDEEESKDLDEEEEEDEEEEAEEEEDEEADEEFEDLDEEEDVEKEAEGIADEEEIEDEFEDLDEDENEPKEKEADSKSEEDGNEEEFEELDKEEFEELDEEEFEDLDEDEEEDEEKNADEKADEVENQEEFEDQDEEDFAHLDEKAKYEEREDKEDDYDDYDLRGETGTLTAELSEENSDREGATRFRDESGPTGTEIPTSADKDDKASEDDIFVVQDKETDDQSGKDEILGDNSESGDDEFSDEMSSEMEQESNESAESTAKQDESKPRKRKPHYRSNAAFRTLGHSFFPQSGDELKDSLEARTQQSIAVNNDETESSESLDSNIVNVRQIDNRGPDPEDNDSETETTTTLPTFKQEVAQVGESGDDVISETTDDKEDDQSSKTATNNFARGTRTLKTGPDYSYEYTIPHDPELDYKETEAKADDKEGGNIGITGEKPAKKSYRSKQFRDSSDSYNFDENAEGKDEEIGDYKENLKDETEKEPELPHYSEEGKPDDEEEKNMPEDYRPNLLDQDKESPSDATDREPELSMNDQEPEGNEEGNESGDRMAENDLTEGNAQNLLPNDETDKEPELPPYSNEVVEGKLDAEEEKDMPKDNRPNPLVDKDKESPSNTDRNIKTTTYDNEPEGYDDKEQGSRQGDKNNREEPQKSGVYYQDTEEYTDDVSLKPKAPELKGSKDYPEPDENYKSATATNKEEVTTDKIHINQGSMGDDYLEDDLPVTQPTLNKPDKESAPSFTTSDSMNPMNMETTENPSSTSNYGKKLPTDATRNTENAVTNLKPAVADKAVPTKQKGRKAKKTEGNEDNYDEPIPGSNLLVSMTHHHDPLKLSAPMMWMPH